MTAVRSPDATPRRVVLGASPVGRRLAADLATHLDADLPGHRRADVDGNPGPGNAERTLAEAVADAWSSIGALILVMASGAATRLIAPHLRDKRTDPAVVCVDDAARFVIALTGGHEGGANDLATRLARHLGAVPVVTTASELDGSTSPG
jgi:cobalt-precorrin 5A hydrolase / precorrin-3B C17-methyltransferase